jgi:D-glycero-alpha-D-manno-heptose 1-phosphate guanylyltransferase
MGVDEAIILAGGLGTRLRSVVSDMPKPMAPINGRPFLAYLIDYWIDQGVGRFVLSVGYLSEKIVSYFGESYRGCAIRYVHEIDPLGTGGGLKKVLFDLEWDQDQVMMMNGDTWYEISLKEMVQKGLLSKLPMVMALKPIEKNDRYGEVQVRDGKVLSFGQASGEASLINGGCYLLNVKEIKAKMDALPEKFSLEQDLLVGMAAAGEIAASVQDAKFLDIGVPEDYKQAANFLGVRI